MAHLLQVGRLLVVKHLRDLLGRLGNTVVPGDVCAMRPTTHSRTHGVENGD